MDAVVDLIAKENLLKAFNEYGIEGTEQVILRVYTGKLQVYMLRKYREIIHKNVGS